MRVILIVGAIVAAVSVAIATSSSLRQSFSHYVNHSIGWVQQTAAADGGEGESNHENLTQTAADHSGAAHSQPSHDSPSHGGGEHHAQHRVVVTAPAVRDITVTQQYVCQIHSRRHIEVRAIEGGYLKEIKINEGQAVKKGDTLFHILPTLYEARLEADLAEARLAQVEYDNTKNLVQQNIVSDQELKLAKAKLAKALAKVKLAQAEMNFADIKAPFDGIIDRLHEQEGSLIEEAAMLTTMSDNGVMWVYFNVPEARYLEYQAATHAGQDHNRFDVRLKLANHETFPEAGKIAAIEADFNNETGNIAFRADFPNPNGLLRHGQTGTILLHQTKADAIVIPQRATYEILAKKYAYVVDKDGIAHQREIQIQSEQDDIYIIKDGLQTGEQIVLEGILQVRDGEKVDFEFKSPDEVLSNLKYHAE